MTVHWSMENATLGDLAGRPDLFEMAFGRPTVQIEIEKPIWPDTRLKNYPKGNSKIERHPDPEFQQTPA